MSETTQQEKTTQLGSRNETTQLASRNETTQLVSRNETTQLCTAVDRLQPPATAYNRLQPPTTACNRLQPPATACTACTAFTAESAFSTYLGRWGVRCRSRHLIMIQNYEVRCQQPSCCFRVQRYKHSLTDPSTR
ncbi:hypothetical protein TNCV_4140031 [Trichonephila clavipes]|nr:hypothetical protein TNCV_4140031 [Trichonephila clavipes]